jgi:hypothetical protein
MKGEKMSIRYWISTRISKDANPKPRSLGDCTYHAWNYEVPKKVEICIDKEEIVGIECGSYISLHAYFDFEFKEYHVVCEKQLGFFGIPVIFKSFGRNSVKKANKKLSDIIDQLEKAGIKKIKGRTERFEINDFPYLLYKNEIKPKQI